MGKCSSLLQIERRRLLLSTAKFRQQCASRKIPRQNHCQIRNCGQTLILQQEICFEQPKRQRGEIIGAIVLHNRPRVILTRVHHSNSWCQAAWPADKNKIRKFTKLWNQMPRGKVKVSRTKISKSQRQWKHARSKVFVHHREYFVVHHLILVDNTGNCCLTIIRFLNAHTVTICYCKTRAGNHNFTSQREGEIYSGYKSDFTSPVFPAFLGT